MAQRSPGSASARGGKERVRMGALAGGEAQREEPEELQVQLGGSLTAPSQLCTTEKPGSTSQPPNSLLPGLAFQTSTFSTRPTRVGTQGHPRISHFFQLLLAKYLLNHLLHGGGYLQEEHGAHRGADPSLPTSSSTQVTDRAPRLAEWRPLPSLDSRRVMWPWGECPFKHSS